MKNRFVQIIESWKTIDNEFNSINDIIEWTNELNSITTVNVEKIKFNDNDFWKYDKINDCIKNSSNSFFKITGINKVNDLNGEVISSQPIIVQPEIGYLGIIAKEFNGKLFFLMQAKIEPGNINKVQLSPTLQATRSNFMQTHGGKQPNYLEYFINNSKYEVIIDQIQSEQSSRFYGKRNRNIIIVVDDDISIDCWHKWLTLGQIKELMKIDNLVNMDTRTVISCIPFALRRFCNDDIAKIKRIIDDEAIFNSMFDNSECGISVNKVFHFLNNEKMFDFTTTNLVGISSLKNWVYDGYELKSNINNFKVIYCNIEIEGREVRSWKQPLIEANEPYIFGLLCTNVNGKIKYLVKTMKEIGCFDKIELGPTVQSTLSSLIKSENEVEKIFLKAYRDDNNKVFEGIFSEEGGRFYHEQNKNCLVYINYNEVDKLPDGYFWLDYYTLNLFTQFNNCLNIQLRNLISIISI